MQLQSLVSSLIPNILIFFMYITPTTYALGSLESRAFHVEKIFLDISMTPPG